jgi:HEPN domain-containing protein
LLSCPTSCQKFLKGYLVSHGVHPKRTHDLEILLEECSDFDADFQELADASEILTPLAVEPRYPPMGMLEYNSDQAHEALSLARKIGDFVRSKIS